MHAPGTARASAAGHCGVVARCGRGQVWHNGPRDGCAWGRAPRYLRGGRRSRGYRWASYSSRGCRPKGGAAKPGTFLAPAAGPSETSGAGGRSGRGEAKGGMGWLVVRHVKPFLHFLFLQQIKLVSQDTTPASPCGNFISSVVPRCGEGAGTLIGE